MYMYKYGETLCAVFFLKYNDYIIIINNPPYP